MHPDCANDTYENAQTMRVIDSASISPNPPSSSPNPVPPPHTPAHPAYFRSKIPARMPASDRNRYARSISAVLPVGQCRRSHGRSRCGAGRAPGRLRCGRCCHRRRHCRSGWLHCFGTRIHLLWYRRTWILACGTGSPDRPDREAHR